MRFALGPSISGQFNLTGPWGLELKLLAPLQESRITLQTESARLRAGVLTLQVLAEPWATWRVSPALGLGGGALGVWASGDASSTLEAHRTASVVGVVTGSARVRVRFTSRIGAQGDVSVGLALPQVTVRFGEAVAAHLGRPLFNASVGLYVQFPEVTP